MGVEQELSTSLQSKNDELFYLKQSLQAELARSATLESEKHRCDAQVQELHGLLSQNEDLLSNAREVENNGES